MVSEVPKMKRAWRIVWLVFLSVFPISSLLEEVELSENRKNRAP